MAGIAYGFQGRLTEGLAVLDRADAAHQALGRVHLIWGPAMTAMIRGRHHIWAGQLSEADAIAERGYADAQIEGKVECRSWFCGLYGQSALAQGQAAAGLRWCRESLSLVRPLNRKIYVRVILAFFAELAALAGDADRAEELLAEAEASTVELMEWEQGSLLRARAWIAVTRGETATALSLLDEAAPATGPSSRSPCMTGPFGQRERGRRPAGRAGHDRGRPAGAGPSHARLRVDRRAAASRRSGRRRRRRVGKGRQARKGAAAQQRAATLAARCDGASTPALRSVASRVQLTKSEREVAVRAAAGRSNKEIAEALFLSRGTVQNYLHRAYEKLGITSRAELSKAWSNAREPRPSQSAAPVRRSPAAPRITT